MRVSKKLFLVASMLVQFLAIGSVSHAQTAQYDIFPLKPWLYYKYHYKALSEEFTFFDGVSSQRDSGYVEFVIHNSTPSGDTAFLWNVEERRSLFHRSVFNDSIYAEFWSFDTSFFTLTEGTSFNHNLSSDSPSRVWTFPLKTPDTTSPVFRFSDSTSLLVTDYWSGFTNVGPGVSGDSLWFSDKVGLVRRKSYSVYGSNTKDFWSLSIELDGNPTLAIGEPPILPVKGTLHQNYPNPFNPSTTIQYALPQRGHVTLTVFNTLGQQVATLLNGEVEAGYHELQFNAGRLATGLYIYRLSANSWTQTRTMMFIK